MLAGQLKTAHFWLMLCAMIIGACSASGLIPAAGQLHQILTTAMMVLSAYGYQAAAGWQSPAPGAPNANK